MIDIVLLWVDGNDPVWLAEYEKYAPKVNGDKRKCAFSRLGQFEILVSRN